MNRSAPPVLLVTGSKDSGKTTLMVELIRRLRRPGRAVFALKRASQVERVHVPGTDTWRFAEAGALVVGLTWPAGTYVTGLPAAESPEAGPGETGAPFPAVARRLDRPASLEEILDLAAGIAPGREEVVVLAEGFSDTAYPRVHVLARPGRPERPPAGPVLTTWALESSLTGVEATARAVDMSLPLLGRWATEVRTGLSGPDGVPRPGGEDVVGAVLVGGRGRRLGGADKWGLNLGGRPQSERCLETLSGLFARILVVGREPGPGDPATVTSAGPAAPPDPAAPPGPAAPPSVGITEAADLVPDAGPLGGLLTALSLSGGRPVFAVAGDMPFLNPGFIRHMLFVAARAQGLYDVILPRWGDWVEPLHAIYGQGFLARLRRIMSSSGTLAGRRVTDAFAGLRVTEVPEEEIRLFGDPHVIFLNLNTPEDLARAREIIERR